MGYQRTTRATLRTRLKERWESVPFWTDAEANWAINESLRKWNLYVGQWKSTTTLLTVKNQVWYLIGNYKFNQGLTNYWKMEEGSGTGVRIDSIDGLPLTPSVAVTQVPGKHNFAVQVPFGGALTAAAGVNWQTAYSIGLWFTFPTDGTGIAIVAATGGFALTLTKTSGSRLSLGTPAGSATGSTPVTAGSYYHVVLTYSGTGQYSVYLNGALELSFFDITTPINGGITFQAPTASGSVTFDETLRYNIALSQSQVSTLYNGGAGFFIDSIIGTLIYPLRMEWQSYPMNACSIEDMDAFRMNWETETTASGGSVPTRPLLYIPAGLTLFAIWPADSVGGSNMVVDSVLETPILTNDSDFIDLGEEELHALIGEALSIAAFKEGGARFEACKRFHQEFIQAALGKNSRLKTSFKFKKYAGLDTAWSSKPLRVPQQVGENNG